MNAGILVSTDFGSTWSRRLTFPNQFVSGAAVTSSADGRVLVAAALFRVYGSQDCGVTWAERVNPVTSGNALLSLALSGNGRQLFGVSGNNPVFTSMDGNEGT